MEQSIVDRAKIFKLIDKNLTPKRIVSIFKKDSVGIIDAFQNGYKKFMKEASFAECLVMRIYLYQDIYILLLAGGFPILPIDKLFILDIETIDKLLISAYTIIVIAILNNYNFTQIEKLLKLDTSDDIGLILNNLLVKTTAEEMPSLINYIYNGNVMVGGGLSSNNDKINFFELFTGKRVQVGGAVSLGQMPSVETATLDNFRQAISAIQDETAEINLTLEQINRLRALGIVFPAAAGGGGGGFTKRILLGLLPAAPPARRVSGQQRLQQAQVTAQRAETAAVLNTNTRIAESFAYHVNPDMHRRRVEEFEGIIEALRTTANTLKEKLKKGIVGENVGVIKTIGHRTLGKVLKRWEPTEPNAITKMRSPPLLESLNDYEVNLTNGRSDAFATHLYEYITWYLGQTGIISNFNNLESAIEREKGDTGLLASFSATKVAITGFGALALYTYSQLPETGTKVPDGVNKAYTPSTMNHLAAIRDSGINYAKEHIQVVVGTSLLAGAGLWVKLGKQAIDPLLAIGKSGLNSVLSIGGIALHKDEVERAISTQKSLFARQRSRILLKSCEKLASNLLRNIDNEAKALKSFFERSSVSGFTTTELVRAKAQLSQEIESDGPLKYILSIIKERVEDNTFSALSADDRREIKALVDSITEETIAQINLAKRARAERFGGAQQNFRNFGESLRTGLHTIANSAIALNTFAVQVERNRAAATGGIISGAIAGVAGVAMMATGVGIAPGAAMLLSGITTAVNGAAAYSTAGLEGGPIQFFDQQSKALIIDSVHKASTSYDQYQALQRVKIKEAIKQSREGAETPSAERPSLLGAIRQVEMAKAKQNVKANREREAETFERSTRASDEYTRAVANIARLDTEIIEITAIINDRQRTVKSMAEGPPKQAAQAELLVLTEQRESLRNQKTAAEETIRRLNNAITQRKASASSSNVTDQEAESKIESNASRLSGVNERTALNIARAAIAAKEYPTNAGQITDDGYKQIKADFTDLLERFTAEVNPALFPGNQWNRSTMSAEVYIQQQLDRYFNPDNGGRTIERLRALFESFNQQLVANRAAPRDGGARGAGAARALGPVNEGGGRRSKSTKSRLLKRFKKTHRRHHKAKPKRHHTKRRRV
jgi:hypothetical protein